MTRVLVYSAALVVFLAATAMTFSSIFLPNWVSYTITTHPPPLHTNAVLRRTIGLHTSCTTSQKHLHFPDFEQGPDDDDNIPNTFICTDFPTAQDCKGDDRYFCSMWRSVAWLMSFAAILELATTLAFITILAGGKQKRERGWKLLCFLLMLVASVQCASMAIVAYLYDNDTERFFVGWRLDTSFVLCTVSWSIAVLSATCIALSTFIFPAEGGYELIPSERSL